MARVWQRRMWVTIGEEEKICRRVKGVEFCGIKKDREWGRLRTGLTRSSTEERMSLMSTCMYTHVHVCVLTKHKHTCSGAYHVSALGLDLSTQHFSYPFSYAVLWVPSVRLATEPRAACMPGKCCAVSTPSMHAFSSLFWVCRTSIENTETHAQSP